MKINVKDVYAHNMTLCYYLVFLKKKMLLSRLDPRIN